MCYAANLTTRYTYWPDGRVQSVRTSSDAGAPDSYTEYDSAGRVKQTSDTDGPVSQNIYDKAGNLLATVDRFGGQTIHSYDARGNLVRTLYPDGTETRSVYDSMGRVLWSTDRFQGDSACTLNAFTGALVWTNQDDSATTVLTHTMYDSLGRVTGTQRYAGRKIAISNPDGNGVFTMTDPNPAGWTAISSTSTVYDDRGRVVETTDASGLRTGNVYYPNGQLHHTGPLEDAAPVGGPYNLSNDFVHYTTYAYDLTDNLPAGAVSYNSVTDANGNTTRTYMDVLGRVVRTRYEDGIFTETKYGVSDQPPSGHTVAGQTIRGQQITRIDQQGIATDSFHDVSGRLTDVYQPAVTDKDPASATFNQTVRPHWNYQYDPRGNLTKQTDAKGRVTTFAYDERGRRTSRTLPGETTNPAVTETWTYDGKGRVRAHTSFNGKTTLYVYDPDPRFGGRLSEEWCYDRAVTILGQDGVLIPPPPPLIGLPGLPPPSRPNDPTPDEKTVYTYDELGRMHTVTEHVLTDADTGTFEVSRATTTYEYETITGGVTLVDSPEGKLRHEYDPATGRLTRTYTGALDASRTSIDGDGKAITDTRYEYNDLGQLWKTSVHELRDDTLATPKTTTYTYDPVGNLDTVTLPNGQVSDYDYDDLNRLDVLTVRDAQSDKLFEQDYTLASDGQRESVLEKRYDGTSGTPFSTTFIDWTYDALNRLTGETRDEGNNGQSTANDYVDSYEFDLTGNRVSKVHNPGNTSVNHVTTNEYNVKDQLTKEEHNTDADPEIDEIVEYTYDKNGSTISRKENDTVVEQYQYDLRNRLAGIDNDADGDIASVGDVRYGYDHEGNRTSKEIVGTGTTHYHNDPQNPTGYSKAIEEKTTLAALPARTYIFGHDILAQVDDTGAMDYLLKDGHGTTRALADASGSVVETYDFDAYLNPLGFDPADAGTEWLAPDGRTDAESDFRLNGARYMTDHRFITTDPGWEVVGNSAEPGTLHLYGYTRGNPVNGTDPSGFDTITTLLKATQIGADLIARVGLPAAKVYFAAAQISLRIISFLPTAALALEATSVGLDIFIQVTDRWSQPQNLPADVGLRGKMLGHAAGQNLGDNFEAIDDFRHGFATSIRTHDRATPEELLRVLKSDLQELSGVERRRLTGMAADNIRRITIEPGMIKSKGLLVGIPENSSVFVYDREFIRTLNQYARQFKTAIKVVPVRGWRR
jgi:YD repeat-containing protein